MEINANNNMKYYKESVMKIYSAALRSFLGLLVFGASLSVSSAFAEGCTPYVSVPVVITEPGTCCLTGDL